MSRLRDLLRDLQSSDLRFSRLGDHCEIFNGFAFKSEQFNTTGDGLPLIRIRDVNTAFSNTYYSGTYDERYLVNDGDLLVSMDGDFKAIRWPNGTALLNQRVCRVQNFAPDVIPAFVHHFLVLQLMEIHNNTQSSTVKHLSSKQLQNLRFPVLPVEVQEEIVAVLDRFAELEVDLEASLELETEARRAQFSHYRNGLLISSTLSEVPMIPLGDLADFRYGFTSSAAETGDFRFLRITDIDSWGKLSLDGAKYIESSAAAREYLVQPGDLLMARTGATYGKTMLVTSDVPAVYASYLIRIRFKESDVLPGYYWHFAQSSLYWSQAGALVSRGGQPQFNANALKLVKMPVPPVSDQERIVEILDRFDALVKELSTNLPSEISRRRTQYEHFRRHLLTFEDVPVLAGISA